MAACFAEVSGPEIFGDVELIKRARLKLPIVVDLYKELVSRDLLDDSRPPRNILELTDLVESRNRGTNSQETLGKIYICNVDDAGPEEIKSILNRVTRKLYWSHGDERQGSG